MQQPAATFIPRSLFVLLAAITAPSLSWAAQTSLTLTVSADRLTVRTGESVRLSATLTSALGTPTGSIQFKDASTTPETVYPPQPLTAGAASRLVLPWSAGTHHFVATYLPDTTAFAGASSAVDVAVRLVTGSLHMWGYGQAGNIGDGTATLANPNPIANGVTDAIVVASSTTITLALKADGTVWSWGTDGEGALGLGPDVVSSLTPQQIATDGHGEPFTGIVGIAAGGAFAAAIKYDDGRYTVWAWGRNDFGQVGDGTREQRWAPVQVKDASGPLAGIVSLAAGANHTLALRWDGRISSWGFNGSGEIGNGTLDVNDFHTTAVRVDADREFTRVAAGVAHSLALDSGGAVYGWGRNVECQLGSGCGGFQPLPMRAQAVPADIVEIAAGEFHSAGLKADGTVRSWGYNVEGQIGNGKRTAGSTVETFQIAPGVPLDDVTQIAAGALDTIALQRDGTVWVAGDNGFGTIGDGTIDESRVFAARTAATDPFDVVFLSSESYTPAAIVRRIPTTMTLTSPTAGATTYGQNVVLVASVSAADGSVATGVVTFTDDAGVALGSAALANGIASLTTPAISAGSPRAVKAAYEPTARYLASSAETTRTVNRAPTTVTLTPASAQYSDVTSFETTVTGSAAGAPARSATFKVGTLAIGTAPLVWDAAAGLYRAKYVGPLVEPAFTAGGGALRPGAKTVTLVFNGVSANYALAGRTSSMSVLREDAAIAFLGQPSLQCVTNCSAVVVPLRARVSEIDASAGDLRNATVAFVNRTTGVTIGTVAAGADGIASLDWTVNLGTAASQTTRIGIMVGGYYLRSNAADDVTVTVTRR